ncbi:MULTISPECIES: hypothetical protein [unclassified Pseudomonas]|uniref:hypothetical protein n=1 Tax=unclassified Pseudomonas TaxID=196821 RepID=UPI00210BD74B|nr:MULTISPECIES: hypothetical protein [unclassified Pseudomonas]
MPARADAAPSSSTVKNLEQKTSRPVIAPAGPLQSVAQMAMLRSRNCMFRMKSFSL